MKKRTALGAAVLVVAAAAATAALANTITGPSSSQSPYVVRSLEGVVTKSILTVGDSVNAKPDGTPYRMVGIPDGLGAFDNGNGTFTVLMNHELPNNRGITRAHGAIGAFVSKWTIQKGSLRVLHGEDLIQQVATWNAATGTYNAPAKGIAISRLCSANLPEPSAFYDAASGLGYDGYLFMDGEETGAEGRAFAHGMDGTSWELPALGKFSWENSIANPAAGAATVVVGTDDSTPGEVYVYVGQKKSTGNPAVRAGLTGGTLYGVKVTGFPTEPGATGIPSGTPFTLAGLGNRENSTGASLQTASTAAGVTTFLRPEDASWDPTDPSRFYFVTTNGFDQPSRLWRLDFADLANPAAGGTIEMLLEGPEGGHQMFDNITVNDRGQVLLQEDTGNQAYIARIWRYTPETDSLDEVAHHDETRFAPGAPDFLTQDEESSGIIPAPFLGEGWYLGDVQAHYATDTELVEGGQLFALHVPLGKK
jgi:Alkaline phosphatase PhoX